MKKGQIIEGVVERVDFPNKGIVVCEEGVCTVKNALPGQRVRAAVNKARNGRYEGRLLEVLAPSPAETGSPCPHFGSCGGCTYLSLPYEESLKVKEGQVRRLLASVLSTQETECQFEGIKASPAVFGYRNKMEFTFGDEVKDGPLSLGMHKRGSFYDIVSVTDCQIVEEDYRKILRCARDYFCGAAGTGCRDFLLSQAAPHWLPAPSPRAQGGENRGDFNCAGDDDPDTRTTDGRRTGCPGRERCMGRMREGTGDS